MRQLLSPRTRLLAGFSVLVFCLHLLITSEHGPSLVPVRPPKPKVKQPFHPGDTTLNASIVEEDDHDFSPLSPLKSLGFDSWMGINRKILITGGTSELGQALLPNLLEEYTVHVLDTVSPSLTLPSSSYLQYLTPTSTTTSLQSLLSSEGYVGIIHLAGVFDPELCDNDPEVCSDHNVRGVQDLLSELHGKSRKRWLRGTSPKPWVILGSSVLVHPDQAMSEPSTALGKSKAQAEHLLREVSTPGSSSLSAAVVRFPTVYGFPASTTSPRTFIGELLRTSVASLSIQYDSDAPPTDLVHIDDVVRGVIDTVAYLESLESPEKGLIEVDLVSGKRWSEDEVVQMVRRISGSNSPLKDIGSGEAATGFWTQYDPRPALSILDWHATIDLRKGLEESIIGTHRSSADWALSYHQEHCPRSPSIPRPPTSPVIKENERNRALWKLDGCTVNLAFERDGYLDYVKCPNERTPTDSWFKDGHAICSVDNEKVVSYNWDASVFVVRRIKGSTWTSNKERRVRVQFEEEKGLGYLGLLDVQGVKGFELVGNGTKGQKTFDLEASGSMCIKALTMSQVAEDNSYLRLYDPVSAKQIRSGQDGAQTALKLSTPSVYDMRMNVLCCPSEGDWPLLADDYESADIRFGTTGQIPFNSSRRTHQCQRAEQAYLYNTARQADLRSAIVETVSKGSIDKVSHQPHDWAMKDMPACWNDCSSPAICVQTGSCRCVQSDCPSARALADRQDANRQSTGKTGGAGKSALGVHGGHSPVLVQTVQRLHWQSVLLPSFKRYMDKTQGDFPKLYVVDGYPGQEAIESAECHKLQKKHCFSADSIMYKAMRHLSVADPKDAELVVLPVYQHCDGAKFLLHNVMHYANENIPGVKDGTKKVALVLTHDWGICIAFAWEIWSARHQHTLYPDWILNNVLVWSVMGDFDSPCYRPHQDVVVPPRTCLSETLKETFGDLANVVPARDRPRLVTWSGTYWGTGKSERLRMTCDRGGAGQRELVEGRGPQSSWISWDYMKELSSARFCPQPRGIAGWSPRVNEAIYAGCIPVLTAEGSHYPFANALDWSKFSVRVLPTQLDLIEAILSAIPLEQVEEMQANLMLIRDAFVYSSDDKPGDELDRRGPTFWALHEAWASMGMQYPLGDSLKS